MRQLDDLKPAEIKAAVPAVFPESGHAESYQLVWTVAEHLGSSSRAVPPGYQGNRVEERYVGRVKRALDALAAEGMLVRVGSKERPPDGASPGDVHYYTPEAYAAAKAQAEEREAAKLAYAARARRVNVDGRLAALGIKRKNDGTLSLEDWEHLLEATGL